MSLLSPLIIGFSDLPGILVFLSLLTSDNTTVGSATLYATLERQLSVKTFKMFIIFKIFKIFKKFKRFDKFKKLRPDKCLAPMNRSQW